MKAFTLRPITWWDKVAASDANTELMIFRLACRIVLVDKKPLTMEAAQEMPLHEAAPIITAVTTALLAAMGMNKPEAPIEPEKTGTYLQ